MDFRMGRSVIGFLICVTAVTILPRYYAHRCRCDKWHFYCERASLLCCIVIIYMFLDRDWKRNGFGSCNRPKVVHPPDHFLYRRFRCMEMSWQVDDFWTIATRNLNYFVIASLHSLGMSYGLRWMDHFNNRTDITHSHVQASCTHYVRVCMNCAV